MKLLSVNVGLPQLIVVREDHAFTTAIFKTPVQGRVMLRTGNLDGDRQADLSVHGGIYKAVYAYTYEHYAAWGAELAREDFSYGQFGENFTLEGLTEDNTHIGDVFRIGGALVEVTQPRSPCFKLAYKMGDKYIQKTMLANGRTGFYLRVLEEGEVGAGDVIERVSACAEQMTVRQIHNLMYFDKQNTAELKRALNIPALAPGWRDSFIKFAAG